MKTIPHLGTFEPRREKALQGYLRRAVSNQIRDELRRATVIPPPEEFEESKSTAAAPAPSALDLVLSKETEARLANAIARLNDTDRIAVVARLRLDYSYEQIALVLGKRSSNAARMAVTRALARVAEHMSADQEDVA